MVYIYIYVDNKICNLMHFADFVFVTNVPKFTSVKVKISAPSLTAPIEEGEEGEEEEVDVEEHKAQGHTVAGGTIYRRERRGSVIP